MAHAELEATERRGIWFLDSGCSNHMTGDKNWFVEIDDAYRSTVKLGNNSKMSVMGKGSVRFEVEGITQTITEVYYIPDLSTNLLSVGQLQEHGLAILIKVGTCKIYHSQRGLIVNTRMTANRMFLVSATMKSLSSQCLKIEGANDLELWHKRFGHLNNKSICTMEKMDLVKGLPQLATTKQNL
ncbi:unnamed protein product [Rhodiola kirilowii]